MSGEEVEDHGGEAGDAEMAERVEEDDCCVVPVEVGDGGECLREDGVGYDQVEQGGFASSRWVMGGRR